MQGGLLGLDYRLMGGMVVSREMEVVSFGLMCCCLFYSSCEVLEVFCTKAICSRSDDSSVFVCDLNPMLQSRANSRDL
jgi:hypothetical protein